MQKVTLWFQWDLDTKSKQSSVAKLSFELASVFKDLLTASKKRQIFKLFDLIGWRTKTDENLASEKPEVRQQFKVWSISSIFSHLEFELLKIFTWKQSIENKIFRLDSHSRAVLIDACKIIQVHRNLASLEVTCKRGCHNEREN